MEQKPLLLVIGANPAWQKTLVFENFTPGKVNRASSESNYCSGKGINFCRAAKCSLSANTEIFQFAGGINGKRLCEDLERQGFTHHTTETDGETRNCITCLTPDGKMTEIIGVSYPVSEDESNRMLSTLYKRIKNLPASGKALLAISGSLPDGSDPSIYSQAAEFASGCGIPVLLDTLLSVPQILSLPGSVILKVNQEEFFKITGKKDIISAHRFAALKYPGKIFAVTNGKDTATLSDGRYLFEYTLPEIKVVSPLGAGDTASALMAALIARGDAPCAAFKEALAAASANCLSPVAGEYSLDKASAISAAISVKQTALQESK